MEVKMTPVALSDIPGFTKDKSHDTWAKEAIEEFVKSGNDAVLLDIPEFGVKTQTVVNCLRMYANTNGVKVRNSTRKKPRGGKDTYLDTYLIRKEALDAQR